MEDGQTAELRDVVHISALAKPNSHGNAATGAVYFQQVQVTSGGIMKLIREEIESVDFIVEELMVKSQCILRVFSYKEIFKIEMEECIQ